jgi:nucleotide-binding universal stress UspA family protein
VPVGSAEEEHVDLIVVGNRGLNALTGELLGPVPAGVARGAPCDVLIVQTTPAPEAGRLTA